MKDNDETEVGAAADDTEVVGDTATAKAATEDGLAWSLDDTEEYRMPGRWRSHLLTAGLTALVIIAAVGVAAFGLHLLEHRDQAPRSTPAPVPSAAPAPAPPAGPPAPAPTTLITIQAAPPPPAPPPEPKLEGVDAHFINFLRTHEVGSTYVNFSNATLISNARLVCTDMLRGTTFDNVGDNLGLSPAQLAWFADTASANYCPQYGGNY